MLLLIFTTFAKPNSLDLDCLTLPPISLDIIWWPKHIPRTGTFEKSRYLLNFTFLL